MTEPSDLPYLRMPEGTASNPKTTKSALGQMYTINQEPSWLAEASPTEKMRLKYESLDYDEIENYLSLKQAVARTKSFFTRQTIIRWLITLLIGVSIALVAFAMDMGVRWLTFARFYFTHLIAKGCDDCFWKPYLIYTSVTTILIAISSSMAVLVEPVAGGSGIGEIKCYLNGVKVPHILRVKTLLAKLVGTMFSVSAGLAVGPEGPMIHIGAITAAGVSQGKSTTFKNLDSHLLSSFRNDREKRDFVNGGAAAGMAAALGTPIGGVLFTLEEGASFWNQALTWRTFFCSMVGAFVVNVLLSGVEFNNWGALSQPGLVNFGTFSQQQSHGYTIVQLPFFILLGVIGGFLGALFNFLNKKLTMFRMRHLKRPFIRFIEAIAVAIVTSTLSFVLSYYFHSCSRIPSDQEGSGSEGPHLQFFCPKGYYNDMATIFFTSQEDAIKQLLHNSGEFSKSTLALFAFTYFSLACWTFGIAIPSGLFVPSLISGGAVGRLLGNLVDGWFPKLQVNPGTFALIGAASVLGGKTRMTISLTVILLEATNDVTYGLPLMVTLMVAKWIGDWFNPGIYDIHIELKEIPLLEWEPDPILRKYKAHHVMSSPVVTFSHIDRVSSIYWALNHTSHNGFPVLDKQGLFCGLILRSQLLTLLKEKAFTNRSEIPKRFYQKVSLEDFSKDYPRFGDIRNIQLESHEFDMYMDLRPYMSCNLFVVQQDASMMRVFRVFRSLGLRHLIVVNKNNHVVGMITRKDLVYFKETVRANRRVGF